MKMTKKILAMALCMAMIISSFAFTVFADTQAATVTDAEAFAAGVSYDSEASAIPYSWRSNSGTAAKVADPDGSDNYVTKLSGFSSDATIGGIGSNKITSVDDSAQVRFDFMISGFVNTNTDENKDALNGNSVLKLYAYSSTDAADPWINSFSIVKTASVTSTDLVTDVDSHPVAQDTWYTVILDHDAIANTLIAKIKLRGAADDTAVVAGTATYTRTVTTPVDTFYLVTNHGKLANLSALTYYIDNFSIMPYTALTDAVAVDKYNDKLTFDGFVAPGFDSAYITIGSDKIAIEDNGTGYYTFTANAADVDYAGNLNAKVVAKYGKSIYTANKEYNLSKYGFVSFAHMYFDGATVSADGATVTLSGDTPDAKVQNNTYAIVAGKSGAEGDNALQLNLANNTSSLIGWADTAYIRATQQTNRILKMEFDIKPLDNNVRFLLQTQTNNSTWTNKMIVHDDVADTRYNNHITGTDYYVEVGEWNHFTAIYDLVANKIYLYYENNYCGEQTLPAGTLTTVRLVIKPVTGATGTALLDNFDVSWTDYNFKGVTSFGYTADGDFTEATLVPANADALTINVANQIDDTTANLIKAYDADGDEISGTASVVNNATADTSVITFTPDSLPAGETVSVKIPAGVKVIRKVDSASFELGSDMEIVYNVADENGAYIGDVDVIRDGNKAYASFEIDGIAAADVANLFVVGYKADYNGITGVNVVPVSAVAGSKFVTGATNITNETEYVRAYIWTPELKPIKAAELVIE